MRNLDHKIWTVCLLLAIACLIVFTKPAALNVYTRAQLGTVLIDVPGGWGTGFVIRRTNPDGNSRVFVWTARHVVEDEPGVSVMVFVRDAEHRRLPAIRFPVLRVWKMYHTDAALLWVDASPAAFVACEFDEKLPALGDKLFVCANSFGPIYDGMITDGIVSQFGLVFNPARGIDWPMSDQMTAAVSPGGSGGPVFSQNSNRVIGMAVGTAGNSINVYLPTRELLRAATEANVAWAIHGESCPSDERLRDLAPVDVWDFIGKLLSK